MSKIVTVQIMINAIFGEVDEDGNVFKKHPINLECPKLNEESFAEAYKALKGVKDKIGKENIDSE